MEPLVSIGVTCYNRPDGLRHTLECLTNQTYKNIEIVVSDNASPNPSVQWVGYEFAYRDPRVKYYRQAKNMGGMYNAKFVLKNSHGKYFMFACDDDGWDPKYVEFLLKEHLSHDCALSMAGTTFVDNDKNEIAPLPIPNWFNNSRFAAMFFMISSHHWAYAKSNIIYGLYKRDFLNNLILYEGCPFDIGNDVLTVMRIISKGDIRYVQKNLMEKGFVSFHENTLGHFHILGPIRSLLNKVGIKKYPQHDGIDEFTKSASEIISGSGFTMIQQIVLLAFNQINRIRLMVLF